VDKERVLLFVFAAAGGLTWAIMGLFSSRGRRTRASGAEDVSTIRRLAEPFEAYGYQLVSTFLPRMERRVKILIDAAGGMQGLLPRQFFGIQILVGVWAGFAALLMFLLTELSVGGAVGLALLVFLSGWYMPYSRLMSTAKQRRRVVMRELPFCLDLMATSMQAGYDFNAAVGVYVERGRPGPLREELAMMVRHIRLGRTRREALEGLAERVGLPEVRTMTTAVIEGSEMGSGVADIIMVQAEDLRRKRFILAEKLASHAPAKMIFPMALLIVPATFIVIITPIVLKYIRR